VAQPGTLLTLFASDAAQVEVGMYDLHFRFVHVRGWYLSAVRASSV
jgi:hypothetical protein